MLQITDLTRCPRLMANETAMKAPTTTPVTVMTSAMTMRLAMMAPELFRATVSRNVYRRSRFPESSVVLTERPFDEAIGATP